MFPARDYQASAYTTFMSNPHVVKIDFKYPGNIVFSLKKMNSGAQNDKYSRICVLENERGEKHLLSDNEAMLKEYVRWKNRYGAMVGGAKKRKSVKRKSAKRKSVKRN